MIVVTPDISLVYQMANFIILLLILNQVLYRPVRSILLERKNKLAELENSAAKAQTNLSGQKEAYKDGIKAARLEGLKAKEAQVEAAAKEEKEILEQISQQAAANLARIKDQVRQEVEQARVSLDSEVESFAKTIGEKILGRPC